MYTIDPNLVNRPLSDDMQNPYGWPHTLPSGTGSTKIDSRNEYPWTGPTVPKNKLQGENLIPVKVSVVTFPNKLADPITMESVRLYNEAIRHDEGKTNWSLMPFEALEEINKVLEFGATKYSANNWQEGTGFKYSRVLNSLLRHVFAFMRGEDKDPESGLSHMAHAGCNVLFILYYLKKKARYANDDRQ